MVAFGLDWCHDGFWTAPLAPLAPLSPSEHELRSEIFQPVPGGLHVAGRIALADQQQ